MPEILIYGPAPYRMEDDMGWGPWGHFRTFVSAQRAARAKCDEHGYTYVQFHRDPMMKTGKWRARLEKR